MSDLLIVHREVRPTPGDTLWGLDNRQLTRVEVLGLAAIYWPATEVQNATNIAFAESTFWTGAWAWEGEDSRGLWQINIEFWRNWASYNLFDPQINAYAAHQIWSAEGWKPWSTAKALGLSLVKPGG